MKKMIGLAVVATLALTLSACDFFGSRASAPPASNELVSNETSIGNSEEGFEDNVMSSETGNAADSAVTNSSASDNAL